MPGLLNGRKRTAVALSDGDDQSQISNSSTGSKRARHAHDASESPAPTNGSVNEEAYDNDAHQPGSIVRVKLTNFVTYTAAEFQLGPSLNMIIGPNGTGKSTLVCAICLGLGWSPSNLGRAKELGEFVKHGQTEAEIEIELAASAEHMSNPIIRRVIRKEGNASKFSINNRAAPQKQVTALAKSFSIQIDNLCQFLPQDRVVEFAKLDPVDLLRETQRAAAPEYMVEWHSELKELRKREKKLEIEQHNGDSYLKGLQNKQDATWEDVKRWNERQELVSKSDMLEQCRPLILAKILKQEVTQLKAEIKNEAHHLQQYQAEVEPAQRAQQEMEVYRDQIDQVAKARKRRFEAQKSAADGFASKIDAEQQLVDSYAAEIDAEKQADKQRKLEKKRVEGDIARYQRAVEDNPVEYDHAKFDARQGEVRTKRAALDRQEVELKGLFATIRSQVVGKRVELQNLANQRKALDTQIGQQGNLLKTLSHDTFKAWEWLEKNKATLHLEDDVYAPAVLSCSVPDSRLAAIVEAHLRPQGDLTAITCTNTRDAKIVSDKLVGKVEHDGLGLHQITIRTSPKSLNQYARPLNTGQLHDLGFNGWILDHLQGPEPVLAMLCQNAQLHRAAYALKPISNAQFEAMRQSHISKCVNGNETVVIRTRAEYAGASSISTDKLKPARFFTDQPVNVDEKRHLDAAIAELMHEMEEYKRQHDEAKVKLVAVSQEKGRVDAVKNDIQSEQESLRKRYVDWQGLPIKIATKEEELKNIENLSADTHQRIWTARDKSEKASLKMAHFTLLYAKAVTQLRILYESYVEAEIRLIEASSEVDGYTSDNRLIQLSLQERQQRIDALSIQYSTIRARAKQQINIANRIHDQITPELEEEMAKYSNYTTEELEAEINDIRVRLDMVAEGNPNAIKAFEKREREIKTAEDKRASNAQQLESARAKITEIREKWEPELNELIAKISDGFAHNFHQIGCAGQVGVYKDEDFEKWAIQIQVRFRDNETLQILDSHRQSGGERAVSTIFYLMALQDLARSPFRVVDEINQGMDPRNERMVHERMVDIACRERTSQYFLITPKLLPDLKFHPKMKVHCIASGEHMPDQGTDLDFGKLAKVALRVRKGVGVKAC